MLKSIGYDAAGKELEIEFNNGRVYRYREVPEEGWQQLQEAESKGRSFLGSFRGV